MALVVEVPIARSLKLRQQPLSRRLPLERLPRPRRTHILIQIQQEAQPSQLLQLLLPHLSRLQSRLLRQRLRDVLHRDELLDGMHRRSRLSSLHREDVEQAGVDGVACGPPFPGDVRDETELVIDGGGDHHSEERVHFLLVVRVHRQSDRDRTDPPVLET